MTGPFVALRKRLGTCQMGQGLRGCWRRPDVVWVLDSFSVPLCWGHLLEIHRAVAPDGPPLGEWRPIGEGPRP